MVNTQKVFQICNVTEMLNFLIKCIKRKASYNVTLEMQTFRYVVNIFQSLEYLINLYIIKLHLIENASVTFYSHPSFAF